MTAHLKYGVPQCTFVYEIMEHATNHCHILIFDVIPKIVEYGLFLLQCNLKHWLMIHYLPKAVFY